MTEPLKIRGFAKLKMESISDYGGEAKENAARMLSTSYGKRVELFDRYLLWLSSGRVRQALAALNDADNVLTGEQEIAENLKAIEDVVLAMLTEGCCC